MFLKPTSPDTLGLSFLLKVTLGAPDSARRRKSHTPNFSLLIWTGVDGSRKVHRLSYYVVPGVDSRTDRRVPDRRVVGGASLWCRLGLGPIWRR